MNIVAFGCSSTYGEALGNEKHNDPSPLAWPQKLADLYKCTVDNRGESGKSNKEILHKILNYNYTKEDVVFVCWTFFDRYCLIRENGIYGLGIWQVQKNDIRKGTVQYLLSLGTEAHKEYKQSDKVAKAFFENIHDTHDMILDFYRNCMLANLFLKDKGIKSFHTYIYNGYTPIENYYESNPWFDYKRYLMPVTNLEELTNRYPQAQDGIHPGPEAHKKFAYKLHDYSQKWF